MAINKDNFCVIMGGGIGSRFWPFSRKTLPKQFLDFFGTGRSLLQQTFDRFKKIIPTENIIVVTNALYADLVQQQLPELKAEQILLEPARRNTAPCIAWASYHIRAINPNANIVVAPSDHLILKEEEFLTAIEKGLDFVAGDNKLLTLGIKPNRPETGYGYIQIAEPAGENFYKVKTFTEKPELELAKVFVESGEFYWNSGLFMWNVNSIIKAGEELLPELAAKLDPGKMSTARRTRNASSTRTSPPAPTCPSTSASWRRPTMSTCRWATSDGRTSAPGARSTTSRTRTRRET